MVAGVAVIADSTWAALKGKELLKVTWGDGPHKSESSKTLREQCEKLTSEPGKVLRDDGDLDRAFAEAKTTLSAVYEVPFLAHAAMEPMNCIADVREDSCEIWAPTQVPGTAHGLGAGLTGLPEQAVTVHMTNVGGGFGRRLMADYVAEAVTLSREIKLPVQVVWTREDDLQHDYYRPVGFHRLRAAIDDTGKLVGWHVHLASASRYKFRMSEEPPETTEIYPDGFPAGFIPNFRMEYSAVETGVPTGALRGPGHTGNAFADQCFLDEIAHEMGTDPLQLRIELLGEDRDIPYDDHGGPTYNTGRLKKVFTVAAQKAGWNTPLPKGRARGIAGHFVFGSYAAHVIEVSFDSSQRVQIDRIVVAVDCGLVINPNGAKAQVEGAVIHGLSAALHEEIVIRNGGAVQSNFDQYRLLTIGEVPKIEVYFVPGSEIPSGLGEIPLPQVAPALCNAIFALTGKRIRRLPIRLDRL
jgi:isoquinoline 1-oxidoreductase beta subunit